MSTILPTTSEEWRLHWQASGFSWSYVNGCFATSLDMAEHHFCGRTMQSGT
jgi:hypothetical protein